MNFKRIALILILAVSISVICYTNYKDLLDKHPSPWELAYAPDYHHGKFVYMKAKVISKVGKGYVVEDHGYRIHVVTEAQLNQGDYAMIVGRFDKEWRIYAHDIEVVPLVTHKTVISYVLAFLVVVVFASQFFRAFRVEKWQIY
ncbi:MAG: hypothetical protein HY606_01285 [Planctomycetes bacterium]|nr:hypothetical protein [Planctomycetota bacterium]